MRLRAVGRINLELCCRALSGTRGAFDHPIGASDLLDRISCSAASSNTPISESAPVAAVPSGFTILFLPGVRYRVDLYRSIVLDSIASMRKWVDVVC